MLVEFMVDVVEEFSCGEWVLKDTVWFDTLKVFDDLVKVGGILWMRAAPDRSL